MTITHATRGTCLYSSDEGGETSDEDDGPPYECPDEYTVTEWQENIVGCLVAHRFDTGWYEGQIVRKVTMSIRSEENGKYAVKYSDSRRDIMHDLFSEDYGVSCMWVLIKPKL